MVVGTGVNSGLRYVESHLAISFRRRLTLKAHEMYLKGALGVSFILFYDITVLVSSSYCNLRFFLLPFACFE
jgi:hypothetical protein